MKRLLIVGLSGWSLIVALAYWQADQRLVAFDHNLEMPCDPKFTAQRDAILTGGLAIALVAVLLIMWLDLRQRRYLAAWHVMPTNSEPRKLP